MRKAIKSLMLAAVTGTVVFQAASCADISSGITATAATVTAGGVIYLLFRVVR